MTWRLAAKHADELNLDGMDPSEVAARPADSSAARCEEIGRDPVDARRSRSTCGGDHIKVTRAAERVDRLAGFRVLGVSRVMGLGQGR